MAAVYTVERGTGAGPAWATVTNVRLHTDDTNNQDLTNPVPIAGSLKRSYWANIRLEFSGTFSQIDNIRHFSDGSIDWTFGTSGALQVNSTPAGIAEGDYVQATGTPGDTGDELVANHANVSAKADIETYTTGAPATIDAGPYSSAGSSNHIALQVDVDTDATLGLQGQETLTWRVDEI